MHMLIRNIHEISLTNYISLITPIIDDLPAQCNSAEAARTPSCVFGVYFLSSCNTTEFL